MIGTTTRADRAAAFIGRMAARQRKAPISLLPPVGTGGTYDPVTRTKTEVAYVPVGPVPAVLRDITDDEIKAGLGANWWLAGGSLPTGTATLAIQPGLGVDSKWRIVVDGEERAIVKASPHDAFLKVFYA